MTYETRYENRIRDKSVRRLYFKCRPSADKAVVGQSRVGPFGEFLITKTTRLVWSDHVSWQQNPDFL